MTIPAISKEIKEDILKYIRENSTTSKDRTTAIFKMSKKYNSSPTVNCIYNWLRIKDTVKSNSFGKKNPKRTYYDTQFVVEILEYALIHRAFAAHQKYPSVPLGTINSWLARYKKNGNKKKKEPYLNLYLNKESLVVEEKDPILSIIDKMSSLRKKIVKLDEDYNVLKKQL